MLPASPDDQPTEAGGPAPAMIWPEAPVQAQTIGCYRLIRELGEGGMGKVYEAEEIESGRRLALKVLRTALDSAKARQRFLREGRLAAAVNHPNSVYVYGAEEIDGAPVITMEYVPGGTLAEVVKRRGPLPVAEAVDAILQIAAGLEAAAEKGVLHRDVKPSNCFLDSEGSVKIGDFGLSVSTLTVDQTNLTMSGAIMGTPNYASPEQLRGDAVDVRSDIYSVGVTLFFLLTGKTPFQADNMVKLVAAVLEKPAPLVRTIRPDIPKRLEQIVARCLSKAAAQRFTAYAELRDALLPFSSEAPAPAALGMRTVAGAIDLIASGLAVAVGAIAWDKLAGDDRGWQMLSDPLQMTRVSPTFAVAAYYILFEGLWGAAAGKAICRLRIVGPDRSTAGFPRICARTLAFCFAPVAVMFLLTGGDPAAHGPAIILVTWFGSYLVWFALFCTARKANGHAAIHDLLTGARVIQRPASDAKSRVRDAAQIEVPAEHTATIGPFQIAQSASAEAGQELKLGYDPRLNRKIWIHMRPAGTEATSVARRELNRSGRLHWLAGRRTDQESWDAYEFIPGRPALEVLQSGQSWEVVRVWLRDLTEELAATHQEGADTDLLSMDRVWITNDGRAKLLDFAAGNSTAEGGERAGAGGNSLSFEQRATLFLHSFAYCALAGERATPPQQSAPPRPLPVYARRFLETLREGLPIRVALDEIRRLLEKTPAVTPTHRRVLLYSTIVAVLTFWSATLIVVGVAVASSKKVEAKAPVVAAGASPNDPDHARNEAMLWAFVGCMVLPTTLGALLFRRGVGFRIMRIEIVDKSGEPARRWRTTLRAIIPWAPFFLFIKAGKFAIPFLLVAAIATIAYRLVRPGRPIRERLSGTWLVPE